MKIKNKCGKENNSEDHNNTCQTDRLETGAEKRINMRKPQRFMADTDFK